MQQTHTAAGAPDGEGTHPIVVIVGATGTGKSELALNVAGALAGRGIAAEVVNADAMQLYRGMDIGTAKLPEAQRAGVPHHLLDVLEVTAPASVAWYQPRARSTIEAILRRDAVPILTGGSGLYVSSAIFDFAFPPRDAEIRARLEAELRQDGVGGLYERLQLAAPQTAERIDRANGRRVVRALEINELAEAGHGGELPQAPKLWRPATLIGLHTPREQLTARLDARVEQMWRHGLLDEVAALRAAGIERGVTAARAIGYAQALAQLEGSMSQAEAIVQTQQLTRRYARRQVSWFKRYPDVHWLDSADDRTVQCVIDML